MHMLATKKDRNLRKGGKGMFDLILQGGELIDGSGGKRRQADLAIGGGAIVAIGSLSDAPAVKHIDCRERVVAPGFIDIHSHSDMIVTMPHKQQMELMRGRILQGITTEMVGNCGLGVFPVDDQSLDLVVRFHQFLIPEGAEFKWETAGGYLSCLEDHGIPVNVATLAAHSPIRIKVMGYSDRYPTTSEMTAMRREVESALDSGAYGLSFGLIYFPGRFTRTDELIELARPVGERGGIVAFHQRSGSPEVVAQAIDEIVEVGERSGAAVHISHDHVQGKPSWSLVPGILKREAAARDRGVMLSADVIPYTGVTTTMLAIYPSWALADGVEGFLELATDPEKRTAMKRDMETAVPSWPPWREGAWATNIVRDCGWEGIYIGHTNGKANKVYEGLSAVELGRRMGRHAFDAITDLLLEERGDVGLRLIGISGDLEEEGPLISFIRDPAHAFISDAWDAGRGKPHPGVYGAFPRVLGRYVRETGCLSLEEAVRKMTSLPASIMGIRDRGLVRVGYRADLVVFDPARVEERATYDDPRQSPCGIDYVFVNGCEVVHRGKLRNELCGAVLRSRCAFTELRGGKKRRMWS
jgi:N-acyl-D-amino-acid deacylase